jgi:hypothetical protein
LAGGEFRFETRPEKNQVVVRLSAEARKSVGLLAAFLPFFVTKMARFLCGIRMLKRDIFLNNP